MITLSIERAGKWFNLARYHDRDYNAHGPEALAQFLGISTEFIFPIQFDASKYSRGEIRALRRQYPKESKTKLTREEIIALAVPKI